MDKFTPYEKLSKKKKKEIDRKKRMEWKINPVTRRPENPKAYKRKKIRPEDDSMADFLFRKGLFFFAFAADCVII